MTSSSGSAHRGPTTIAFFGSGPFGLPILDALLELPDVRVAAVVSVPDRPAGRGGRMTASVVAERAAEMGLPLLKPARLRDRDAALAIRGLRPAAAVLADYGKLVPPEILAIPGRGFLNVHPSRLPRHRGATPIQATILAGDREAGVSLFEMDAGLDTGPVIAQAAWPLDGTETAPELEAEAGRRAADLLARTLASWLAGEHPAVPQSSDGATLTRPLSRSAGRLDPALGAVELERQVRAFLPWPGSFVETPEGRFAVLASAAAPSAPGDHPGQLVADDAGLALATGAGRLRLLEVRPAGGKAMSSADLRRGRPGFAGTSVLTGVGA